ncbi:hypothetical protein SAMN05428997_10422 [Bosea sp. CRIB-10]|uniref:hypothetical protein n=1 Tax=Bosea sp. CRIB-10 TaxID=378404 RepID=UPI0008EF6860|nr:hypothetical protein [Bosea sp. CRIB-10]SFC08940.1 hypothetical protein SAMN05428997_10422 [Bosea sp. CRIB-10]
MIRRLAAAALVAALLPASAEAAKFRSGGSRSHTTNASQPHRDGSHVVVTPTLRSRQPENAAAMPQPLRIASPASIATAETANLRGTQPAEPRVWCRSRVVAGGFCVMN